MQGGNLRVEKGEVVWSEVRGFSPNRANIVCPSISKDICVGTKWKVEEHKAKEKLPPKHVRNPYTTAKKNLLKNFKVK